MRLVFQKSTYFERLIYYFLIPDLFAKIVYEIILHVPAITVNQPKQFMFYGFLAIEYGLMIIGKTPVRFNIARVAAIGAVLALMIFQGILTGLWWGNSLARILIDTINVLVVLANLLIFSDPRSTADTDFGRIFTANRCFAVAMVLLSVVAMAVNPVSGITFGGSASSAVVISLLLTELFTLRYFTVANIAKSVLSAILLVATAQSWNRTTLLFLAVTTLIYLLRRAGKNPYRIMSIAAASVFCASSLFMFLPEDSALARRISGLEDVDLSSRTGSIGEREAESDAVSAKIDALGSGGTILGAGHGAAYDVRYTWEWKLNYSNAHYGWVLFYLRYGELGYVYFGAWFLALVLSIYRTWRSNNPTSILICLLAVWNLGYLGTYGYFSFFIAGMPFVQAAIRRPVPRTAPSLSVPAPSTAALTRNLNGRWR